MILKKHLEKTVLALIALLFVYSFFATTPLHLSSDFSFSKSPLFNVKQSSNVLIFSSNKEISLMPGEYLTGYDSKKNKSIFYITKISVKSRSPVTLVLQNNEELTGTILTPLDLSENWKTSRDVIRLKASKSTQDVHISKISRLSALMKLETSHENSSLDYNNIQWSFHQPNDTLSFNFGDKPRWIEPTLSDNEYSYDLFTPPILYMHEGKLLSRVPQNDKKVDEIEPFGLSLIAVEKSEYDFKLAGWVGSTPYFLDLKSANSVDGGNFIRNRVPIGVPQKRVLNRKQGQPSLISCSDEDDSKVFVVENFKVQKIKNVKTGGLVPIGRALVRDFQLGGDPFEINTMMDKVYAGTLLFIFKTNISGVPSTEIELTSKDIGRNFEVGGRLFKVSSFDFPGKSITITKSDPRLSKNQSQVFPYN